MAFSKKGKRKIIYNEEVFYWFVKRDEDYSTDYLNIIKEDSSLVIFTALIKSVMNSYTLKFLSKKAAG